MDKEQQKKLLREIMEADQKNGLYEPPTAVEWLFRQINSMYGQQINNQTISSELYLKSKEMERNQMIDFLAKNNKKN